MSKFLYIGLIVASLLGIACYLGTNSLLLAIVLIAITLMYFLFIISKRFINFDKKIKRFHECYFFVSNMIVSLSIKNSISAALENLKSSMSDEFLEEMETMKDMNENEKLSYLQRYYPFHFYQLFVDVVNLWIEQGGDIIKMTDHLSYQAREVEEYIIYSTSNNKGKLLEFIILWLLTVSIVIVLRFALSVFFVSVSKQLFYQIGIFLIFIFLLFSVELMSRRMCDIQIKGVENETK